MNDFGTQSCIVIPDSLAMDLHGGFAVEGDMANVAEEGLLLGLL